MNNKELIQDFFTNSYRIERCNNLSYNNQVLYSYNTCIAQITYDRYGNKITLISSNNFSNTTAKHLHYVNCYNLYHAIYLPQQLGAFYFDITNMIDRASQALNHLELTRKANREKFKFIYSNIFKLLQLKLTDTQRFQIKQFIKTFFPIYNQINTVEKRS